MPDDLKELIDQVSSGGVAVVLLVVFWKVSALAEKQTQAFLAFLADERKRMEALFVGEADRSRQIQESTVEVLREVARELGQWRTSADQVLARMRDHARE